MCVCVCVCVCNILRNIQIKVSCQYDHLQGNMTNISFEKNNFK